MNPIRQLTSLLCALVAFCGCSDPDVPAPPDDDTLLDPPAAGRGIQLQMRTTIEPGVEVEHCQLFRAPPEGLAINRDEVRFTSGSHHVLLYLTPYQDLPTKDELGRDVDPSKSFDCSDGPTAAWQVTTLIGGSQNAAGGSIVDFPPDVAMHVPPGAVLLMNAHYVNASGDALEPEVRLNLHTIPPEDVRTEGGLLFWYDPFIRIDPHGPGRATMSCPLANDIVLGNGQSHMHRRGVGYLATHQAPGGARAPIYDNVSWADVPVKRWQGGLPIPAGSRIEYSCDYQNVEDRVVWQGPRSTDEMCMFIASYWPADPQTSLCALDPANPLGTQDLAADWPGNGEAACPATLSCLETASMAGDDVFLEVTECVLAARPESSALVSDLVRCLFTSDDPGVDCEAEMGSCLAE